MSGNENLKNFSLFYSTFPSKKQRTFPETLFFGGER